MPAGGPPAKRPRAGGAVDRSGGRRLCLRALLPPPRSPRLEPSSARPAALLPRLALLLGLLFFAYAFVLRVSPSVMVEELMREFAVGAAVLGNLSAIYLYVYAGVQIPVGVALDRFGPRRLMAAAALVAGLGAWLFSVADALPEAYAGRFLVGLGCAFSWPGVLALIYQWFPTRFALLAGIGQTVGMGGAVFGQAPLAAAVATAGWRDSLHALALVGACLAAALWLCVRDRQHPESRGHGLLPRIVEVMANRQSWLAAVYGLASAAPILAFGALWGVPFLVETYALERTQAAGIVSLLFIGSGVAAPVVGWWSDRARRRRGPMIATCALAAAAQAALLLAPPLPLPLLGALVFVVGLGGAGIALSFAVGREHNAPAVAGVAVGVVNMLMVGGGALFQPLIGWLLDLGWDGRMVAGARVYDADHYRLALAVLPAASVLGVIAASLMRETGGRQHGSRSG